VTKLGATQDSAAETAGGLCVGVVVSECSQVILFVNLTVAHTPAFTICGATRHFTITKEINKFSL